MATVGAIGAYMLTVLEVVFMSTPFAAYYYAAYSPVLSLLRKSPSLSRLCDLYVSHISQPDSTLLIILQKVGYPVLCLGIVLFLIHAGYLYWIKLVKKAVATRLLYAYVRHPQYTSLMVAGLGLAIMYPRFVNLILLLVMLVVYYALARHEEQRMERAHGKAYRDYKSGKAMFFPGSPGERLAGFLFGWLPAGRIRVAASFAALFAAALGGSLWLRQYSVENLNVLVLPGAPATLIVAFDPPDSDSVRRAAAQAVARAAQSEGIGDPPAVVYLIWDRHRLRHFLIDGGIKQTAVKETEIPEASYYVVGAAVLDPSAHAHPAVAVDPRFYLSAGTIRRLRSVYCHRLEGRAVTWEEYRIPQDARQSHASLPIL